MSNEANSPLITPLNAIHKELKGRMTVFAGYELPIQYEGGLIAEHRHTRAQCGLFDVSHMGQIELRAGSGDLRDAMIALEELVPVDILSLAVGRQRYGFFSTETGGILDDMMIANLSDRILIIVNAARKREDLQHLRQNLPSGCNVTELDDRALIALQGPKAERALAAIFPIVTSMRFMDIIEVEHLGSVLTISRSGYTGEDGFEISIASGLAEGFTRRLLNNSDVRPIGLGARDSLRLEAGLCLYGSDLGLDTTPVEAALQWAIQKSRRPGGSRSAGYIGDKVIYRQLEHGANRLRVGLLGSHRQPVRAHAPVFATLEDTSPIGEVSSGCFSPTLEAPIAMAYLRTAHTAPGLTVFAEVRGNRIPMRICPTPFVPHTYKRS